MLCSPNFTCKCEIVVSTSLRPETRKCECDEQVGSTYETAMIGPSHSKQ